MLDLVTVQIFLDPLGNKVGAVIRDNGMRDPISGNGAVPDELLRCHGSDCLVRGFLYPFGEVVDRYQDIAMTVGGCGVIGSDNIYSPGRERPWQ